MRTTLARSNAASTCWRSPDVDRISTNGRPPERSARSTTPSAASGSSAQTTATGLRQTGRAFVSLARDRVFAGYALTVAFAYASLFGYIAGSPFVLQEVYGLSATQFSLVFALNAGGMEVLGLLNARLVRRFAVRRLLIVGLVASTLAAVVLLVVVGPTTARIGAVGTIAVLAPLFVVVATRGLVSANATVLALQRPQASGAASAVLGACMFAGGILVTPLLALGGSDTAVPMALVVAGGALAALLTTVLLTRPPRSSAQQDSERDVAVRPTPRGR